MSKTKLTPEEFLQAVEENSKSVAQQVLNVPSNGEGNENDLINQQDTDDASDINQIVASMRPFRYRPTNTAKDILARTSQATGLSYQDIVSVALFALQGAPQGVIASSIAALNASVAYEMFHALK